MADPTFGVKVSPELKEKLDKMIAASDFKTNKEWLEHVISVYEMYELRHENNTKKYSGDLDSISGHLKRVQEIVTEIIKKTSDDLTAQMSKFQQLNDKFEAASLKPRN
jgi:metal-responsive CopG/Arc/MetJ family transcriptional regulator